MSAAPDERFVWWLWQQRRFDRQRVRDAGYEVVFPGWFSTAAGPDFREAIVATRDGRLLRGDVEVHVRPSGWREHGHDRDPAYGRVILQVVLYVGKVDAVTSNGGRVPALPLIDCLDSPLEQLLAEFDGRPPPAVTCPVETLPPCNAIEAISQAGQSRFAAKVARTLGDVEALGREEALYCGVAEALGYSQNRAPFRRLAEGLPFHLLRALSLYDCENLLLAAAGLGPAHYLSPYLEAPILRDGDLVAFRVRPGNAPAVRLRGLARLIYRHRSGMAAMLTGIEPRQLWREFVVEADDALVGRGRADDIVLNVALPYLAATEASNAHEALHALPAPPDNRWTRALRATLEDRGISLRPYRALHHQGLLELALRHCRYSRCDTCPLHDHPAHQLRLALDR